MSSITQNKYKFTSRTIEYFIWGKHGSLPTGSLDLLTASDCPFWMYYNHTLSCLLGTQALWALNSHSTSLDSSGSCWGQRAPKFSQTVQEWVVQKGSLSGEAQPRWPALYTWWGAVSASWTSPLQRAVWGDSPSPLDLWEALASRGLEPGFFLGCELPPQLQPRHSETKVPLWSQVPGGVEPGPHSRDQRNVHHNKRSR